MFSNIKKVIAIILIFLMALLVACSNEGGNTSPLNSSVTSSPNSNSSNIQSVSGEVGNVGENVTLDTCNRMVEEGKFFYKHLESDDPRVTVGNEQMVRNSVSSTKVTLTSASPSNVSLTYNVNGVSNNVGLYVYLESNSRAEWKSAGGSITLKLFNRDSTVISARANISNHFINAGWNFIKFPIDEMSVSGDTSNITKVVVEFSRSKKHTNDIELYVNGLLCDSKMKTAILLSFDGLYSQDADNGGKFDILEEYGVPFTLFCNSNLSTSTKQYERLTDMLNAGLCEIQLYGCRDIDGYAAKYNLTDVSKATLEDSSVEPQHQYEMIKYASDMLRQDFNSSAVCYAGKQANFSGLTYDTITGLGYKMARVSGYKPIGKFTEYDMATTSLGYYTDTDFNTVFEQVEAAIRNGYSLALFTHEVTDNGTQYGTTKEKFEEIIEYLVEKRDNGEIEILNYGQFLESCY